jgi:hypothetical protein
MGISRQTIALSIIFLIAMMQVSLAQPAPSAVPLSVLASGKWSCGDCNKSYYIWKMSGENIVFHDQSGNLDVERIVEANPAGFTSATIGSTRNANGVLWNYTFLDQNTVRVVNMTTGRTFVQKRCETAMQSGIPVPTVRSETDPLGDEGAMQRSAESFMKSLYAGYWKQPPKDWGRPEPLQDLLDPRVEPGLADLWRRVDATRQRRDDIGPLDGDPLCSCQENNSTGLTIATRVTGPNEVTGQATFLEGPDTYTVSVKLVTSARGWQIRDISVSNAPQSLRQRFQAYLSGD